MAKRYSTKGINSHRSYSPEEIATIIGATSRTILVWIKSEGLPAMTMQRPFLIKGADLKTFIERRNKKGKGKLNAGEFRCFTCGARGLPLGKMADYEALPDQKPRLVALCGQCEGNLSMLVSDASLARHQAILDIAIASPL